MFDMSRPAWGGFLLQAWFVEKGMKTNKPLGINDRYKLLLTTIPEDQVEAFR